MPTCSICTQRAGTKNSIFHAWFGSSGSVMYHCKWCRLDGVFGKKTPVCKDCIEKERLPVKIDYKGSTMKGGTAPGRRRAYFKCPECNEWSISDHRVNLNEIKDEIERKVEEAERRVDELREPGGDDRWRAKE